MWFDLTQEVALDKKNFKLYKILRISLYLATVSIAAYLTFIILFPSLFFTFNFGNPNAKSNTIIDPRDETRIHLDHGIMPADQKSYFDTALTGMFSRAVITFILDKKSPALETGDTEVSIRKSYAAFFYPTAENLSEDADSPSANPGAFSDGSLVSYGDSIYIVSGNQIFPIDSPITFLSKGYGWDDVRPASADQIELYEKGKLFTIASPHPDGTIFKTIEDGKYYLIKNEAKYLLPLEKINPTFLDHSPILVSEDSLDITAGCRFEKDFWPSRSYSCEIPIDGMQQLIGSDYEFSVTPTKNIQVDMINVEFKKDISQKNFRFTLSEMFKRIKNNYVPEN